MIAISIQNKKPSWQRQPGLEIYPKNSDVILAKAGSKIPLHLPVGCDHPMYAFEPAGDHDQAGNCKLRLRRLRSVIRNQGPLLCVSDGPSNAKTEAETLLLSAPKPAAALDVTAIGHQSWWEFRYPMYGFVAAKDLPIPVSSDAAPKPTSLKFTSADVNHRFRVPQLAGKTDLIANHVNTMWIDPKATSYTVNWANDIKM